MAKNDFQYAGWNSYTMQCGTITTLISSGDCTLQCGIRLWNRDSKFTKWHHPALWYVAMGWHAIEFDQTSVILEFYIWFPLITAVDMSFCASLRNLIQIGPPSPEKNDVMSIFKMADLRHVGIYGTLLNGTIILTSASETIQKPLLVKAKTALRNQKEIKYGEKRFLSLYFIKRGAYWDRRGRDVVGRWLVGCHARALWPNGAS